MKYIVIQLLLLLFGGKSGNGGLEGAKITRGTDSPGFLVLIMALYMHGIIGLP